MSTPLLLPIAIILGGAYLLTRDAVAAQPAFPPGSQDQFTATGSDGVRRFKADVATGIMAFLATQGLETVNVPGVAPGPVFRLVPLVPGAISARDAAILANTQGAVILGTLSLVLVSSSDEKLLMLVAPGQKTVATPASQWAVLLDSGAGAVIAPSPPGTLPGSAPPFDPGMPAEIVKEVNAAMSDPSADPRALDKMADELEASGFPIAAKALRDRAKAIRLKQRLGDEKAGGTPFRIRATAKGNAADLPFNTAKHYTGDGNRWREIAPINSQIGMIIKDTPHGKNLHPWKAGLEVLLPLDWKVREKSLPAPLTEKGKPSKKASPAPEELTAEREAEEARRESQRMKEERARQQEAAMFDPSRNGAAA